MFEIDQIDHKILAVLRENADIPNRTLAELVGLSPSACLRRVARLKQQGVIRRIVAVIDPAHVDRPLSVIVTVTFERHGSKYRAEFEKRVRKEPTVSQCYMVTGDTTCVLMVQVADMDEYTALADQLFHNDSNVTAFTTHLVMSAMKLEPSLL